MGGHDAISAADRSRYARMHFSDHPTFRALNLWTLCLVCVKPWAGAQRTKLQMSRGQNACMPRFVCIETDLRSYRSQIQVICRHRFCRRSSIQLANNCADDLTCSTPRWSARRKTESLGDQSICGAHSKTHVIQERVICDAPSNFVYANMFRSLRVPFGDPYWRRARL